MTDSPQAIRNAFREEIIEGLADEDPDFRASVIEVIGENEDLPLLLADPLQAAFAAPLSDVLAAFDAWKPEDGVTLREAVGHALDAHDAATHALAYEYLMPMEHLPPRLITDPDDIPRCVGCGFLIAKEDGHQMDCRVAVYLTAIEENR